MLAYPPTPAQEGETRLEFQVRASEDLPCGTLLLNRALLTDSLGLTRTLMAHTWSDLADLPSSSRFRPLQEWAPAGGPVGYEIFLANSGNHPADVTLENPLPAAVTTATEWIGGLTYDSDTRTMHWSGQVPAGQQITLAYTGTLSPSLPDGTTMTNLLTATTPCGPPAVLTATVPVHRADLSGSQLHAWPARVAPGGRITYTLQVANSGRATADPAEATAEVPWGCQLLPETLAATTGEATYDPEARRIHWVATVPSQSLAALRFTHRVLLSTSEPSITQTAVITDVLRQATYRLEATTRLTDGGVPVFLPLLLAGHPASPSP